MEELNYKKVESSNIDSIGYYDKNLYIRYKSGTEYRYYDVPEDVHSKLLESDSKGRFMNSVIKENYKYVKVK